MEPSTALQKSPPGGVAGRDPLRAFRYLGPAFVLVGTTFGSHAACGADTAKLPISQLRWEEREAVRCVQREVTQDDMLSLREIGGMAGTGLSISPDGRHLAFEVHKADLLDNDYEVGWYTAGTKEGEARILVGDGGDATLFRSQLPDGRRVGAWIAEYPKWSPDSHAIVYRKKLNGETQLWWSARDGRATKQLTHSTADVEEFYWSEGGSRLYFVTDADRASLRQRSETRFMNGHVYDYEKDWSTIDGEPLYPPYSLIGGQPRIWVLDLESEAERLATEQELREYEVLVQKRPNPTPNARHAVQTKGGNGIAWLQPDDPDKQGASPPMTLYASLESGGANPVRCPAAECTGYFDNGRPLRDGLQWSTAGDEVYFARMEGVGYSMRSLYGWRIGDQKVRRILTTDAWLSDCSVTGGRAICFHESPIQPRTVVSVDLKDGSIETLIDPNPEFRCLKIGDVELMEWQNSSGYGTFGYLVLPPDYDPDERYPLVFVGYRARYALRGGIGDEYPVHVLASNGFVVLVYDKPTPYAALEVYADPIDIGKARWGPDLFDVRMPLASFESAIQILHERALVDPSRVAVTGLSNGAAQVAYALINSNLFATAIASSCEFSPNGRVLVGASGEEARNYRRAIGAGPHPGPDSFLFPHISLALNADRVRAPLLVNVSDHEHPWALEEVVALQEAGKPVEMIVYPDEGHIKWHPAHRASVYRRNVDWLRFWLQYKEDSGPEKSDQYIRWRDLRKKHEATNFTVP